MSHLASTEFVGLSPENWALQASHLCLIPQKGSSNYGHQLPNPAEEALHSSR